jgi:hypothetical protein
MTVQRAAAYIGGAALLCAWLASAASTARRTPPQTVPAVPHGAQSQTEALARDVQRQAERLRKRLAAAPIPQRPPRNPFAFKERPEPPRRREPMPRVEAPAAPVVVRDEPLLVLIGVAERATPAGAVRTAMIAAEGDQLFLVKAGDTVMGRYQIEIVGADAVQMKDLLPGGGIRRLALR